MSDFEATKYIPFKSFDKTTQNIIKGFLHKREDENKDNPFESLVLQYFNKEILLDDSTSFVNYNTKYVKVDELCQDVINYIKQSKEISSLIESNDEMTEEYTPLYEISSDIANILNLGTRTSDVWTDIQTAELDIIVKKIIKSAREGKILPKNDKN